MCSALLLLLTVSGEVPTAPAVANNVPTVAQQPNQREWYQRGEWPLLGAIAALVVTQLVVVGVAWYNARAALKREVNLRRIAACSERLSGFYNPLYAMCLANGRMFEGFGPSTYPDDPLLAEVAVELWHRVRTTVVLPNNEAMLAVLRDKSHLISEADDLSNYTDLLAHLMVYRLFVEHPTEKHKNYLFPKHVVGHLEDHIRRLKGELDRLKTST
jgi:hypothetical protein